jgi:hypothetical protein
MILLGCLLAFSIAVAPRAVLVLAWLFGDRWDMIWQGEWMWPLLGTLFLPFTTIMYMLAWVPAAPGGGHIEGWDWMWILLGLVLDISKWFGLWGNKNKAAESAQRYYPAGAPSYRGGGGTSAAVSSGQVPRSTSPTASDSGTAPYGANTPPEIPGDDKPGG